METFGPTGDPVVQQGAQCLVGTEHYISHVKCLVQSDAAASEDAGGAGPSRAAGGQRSAAGAAQDPQEQPCESAAPRITGPARGHIVDRSGRPPQW